MDLREARAATAERNKAERRAGLQLDDIFSVNSSVTSHTWVFLSIRC